MTGLERLVHANLERWLDGPRRRPLVIRGARQVGKSTAVRRLADSRGLTLLEVNLEQHRHLEPVFAALDVPRILAELEAIGRLAPAPGTLLFLDEIQATPSALPALRYLYELRPDLPVVAAGSLLEIVLRSHEFSMPVGRIEYLHLGPLTFTEFLRGCGDGYLADLAGRWLPGDPWAEVAHNTMAARQREFLLVGGMPEAVSSYASDDGMAQVRRIHRSIVSTYQDDFAKYGANSTALVRLQRVFQYVPTAVGNKVKYSNIARDERSRDLRFAIDLLALARVIWQVHHSDASGLPLGAGVDLDTYKCLFLDVGLASHMTGVDRDSLGRWDDRQLVHEGGLAEQFIGQHLLFRHGGLEQPGLHYWLREAKSTNAEVDYVIEHRRSVVPIEVKAGAAGRMRSLQYFFARGSFQGSPLAVRFDINPPSVSEQEHRMPDGRSVRYTLLSLPLYMVEETGRLLDSLLP